MAPPLPAGEIWGLGAKQWGRPPGLRRTPSSAFVSRAKSRPGGRLRTRGSAPPLLYRRNSRPFSRETLPLLLHSAINLHLADKPPRCPCVTEKVRIAPRRTSWRCSLISLRKQIEESEQIAVRFQA